MRWIVAKGVTLYVNDDTTFFEGEEVFDWNFESIQEFKGLVAAGKIVPKEEDTPPESWDSWDFYSVDEGLNKNSANPVSNRALSREFSRVDGEIVKERAERESSDSEIKDALEKGLLSVGSALGEESERAKEAEKEIIEEMKSGNGSLSSSFNAALDEEKGARRRADKEEAEAREKAFLDVLEVVGDKEKALCELIKGEASEREEALRLESDERAKAVDDLSLRINTNDASAMKKIEDIEKKMLVVYTLKGSKKFSELPPLSEVKHGWVFDIVDDFVTTDDFKEGAGVHVAAGTNIVALYADDAEYASVGEENEDTEAESENSEGQESEENEAEETEKSLKWDILGGKWDTSEFYKRGDVDSLLQGEKERAEKAEGEIKESVISFSRSVSSNMASILASGEETALKLAHVVDGASEEFDSLKKISDVLEDLRADIEGLKSRSPWLFNQSYF